MLLHCDIWNYLWEILSPMPSIVKYQRWPVKYWNPTLKMKKTMTSHLVTSPMLTVLMKKLRKKPRRLKTAWEAHPDHTITKAMVAERAIFFVLLPFFRFNGDAGMRTVSADISRDEQIHVAVTHWFILSWGTTSALVWINSAKQLSTG